MEENFNILLIIGIAVFGGLISGKLFTKLKLPQVVGFIFAGIIIGNSGLKIIDTNIISQLNPISNLALGIIGFMVGGELELSTFKKYGKQFIYILFFESITTFIIVTLIVGFTLNLLMPNSAIAWSIALLLGAISSASAPAGTTDVLWENKTKGPLTRTILGIVALDDGLGLILFVIASSIASNLIGAVSNSLGNMILQTIYEIGISILLGIIFGFILSKINKTLDTDDKRLASSIGFIGLSLGISIYFDLDMLLLAMTVGTTIVNISKRDSENIFKVINQFFPPINILFFVLIGATLSISSLTKTTIIIISVYMVARTFGKMLGSFLGATLGKSPFTVRNFLPFSLLSQAGVAVGLSILAGQKFNGEVGNIIVIVITASTLIIQLIGPIGVKHAVTKAKEIGLNILPEDILKQYKAKDVINNNYVSIKETDNLKMILEIFGNNDNFNFPVLNEDNELQGIITMDNVKETFIDKDDFEFFLIAGDLLNNNFTTISEDEFLSSIVEIMEKENSTFVAVNDNNGKFINILDSKAIKSFITRKTISSTIKAERLDKISCI